MLGWPHRGRTSWISRAKGYQQIQGQKSAEMREISMGSYVKQYDKGYMKMAMLKQEETFRKQVHELHRLYQVQKLLMNDMKTELKRQRRSRLDGWNSENETDSRCGHENQRIAHQALHLEQPAEECVGEDATEAGEESELELTLATGSGCGRRKKESSFTSDSGASFSSSSAESGGVKLNGNQWGLFHAPDMNLGSYRNEVMKGKFNGGEQMNEEMAKRPPWLLQCLSLNMT